MHTYVLLRIYEWISFHLTRFYVSLANKALHYFCKTARMKDRMTGSTPTTSLVAAKHGSLILPQRDVIVDAFYTSRAIRDITLLFDNPFVRQRESHLLSQFSFLSLDSTTFRFRDLS